MTLSMGGNREIIVFPMLGRGPRSGFLPRLWFALGAWAHLVVFGHLAGALLAGPGFGPWMQPEDLQWLGSLGGFLNWLVLATLIGVLAYGLWWAFCTALRLKITKSA